MSHRGWATRGKELIGWLRRAESDPLLQHSPHAVAAAVVQLLRQGDELALHRNFRALGTASIIKCAHSSAGQGLGYSSMSLCIMKH